MLRRFIKFLLGLDDDQRQNLTTISMMMGTMALTVCTATMVWVLRYSWPSHILTQYAGVIIDGLFKVTFGLLGLMAIQVIAQAVIAIGGRMKASLGAASFEAEAETQGYQPTKGELGSPPKEGSCVYKPD